MAGPPRRWMAPSTPPPPSSDEFAALTIASALRRVMSPWTRVMAVMTASASSYADFDPRRIALRPPRDNRLSDDHSVDLEGLHGHGGEGRRQRLAAQIGVRVGGVEVAAAGGDGVP